jgi:hypothetical protein
MKYLSILLRCCRLWRNEVAHKKAERLKMLKRLGNAALDDLEEGSGS